MRPAGISAILGALVFAVSLPIQPSGAGDSDAERLTKFHDQSSNLIVGQGILIGVALLLFIPALYVLIRSIIGRTQRVRPWTVALAFFGPIVFAISGILVASGLTDVADKFVDQVPAKERSARERASAAQQAPSSGGKQINTTAQTTTAPQGTTTTPQGTTTAPQTPDQAASKARDDLANDLLDDSTLLQVGSIVRFLGLITFVAALIYIPLWSMRTGLLTRFWAMLGLALGVSVLLIPVGIFGVMLWFAVIGLMLAGWWPRPLPPAWETGEAIPWPRPGEDLGPAPEARGRTVEGSGREVSEQPLPESGAEAQPTETQGQRRKKRKRRK